MIILQAVLEEEATIPVQMVMKFLLKKNWRMPIYRYVICKNTLKRKVLRMSRITR